MPLLPYIPVWFSRRKNPPRKSGKQTASYTLQWMEHGKRFFESLGPGATAAYAREAAASKERDLNAEARLMDIEPITLDDYRRKYADTYYPGHDLPLAKRRVQQKKWQKAPGTFDEEMRAMRRLVRILGAKVWLHELNAEDREKFITVRLDQGASGTNVDKELRCVRLIINQAIDDHHCPDEKNPFAGRGRSSIGVRRRRRHPANRKKETRHLDRKQIAALLRQADAECLKLESQERWKAHRVRTLIYLIAYTGVRSGEALNLRWSDVDLDHGVITLKHYDESDQLHQLKTESSQAIVGLADPVIEILKKWKTPFRGEFVFPNLRGRPWTGGSNGDKPLDHVKAVAERAGRAS